MYYSYFTRNGIEYASAAESVRDGKRVTKGAQVYLGRVVDRELHLFRSRERGLFRYDIETGEFLDPPRGYDEPPTPRKNARPRPKVLSVSFGDAWMPGPPSASVRVRGLRRGLLRHSPALCPRSIPSTSCPGSTGAIRTFGIAFRSEEALVG